MSAREEILARIGSAIEQADEPAIPREYRHQPSLTPEERVALFIDRLHDYDAIVHRVQSAHIASMIEAALTSQGKTNLAIPQGFPNEWLPANFDFLLDRKLSYADLDRCQGALTACTVAIALTGTIVLQSGPGQGRRALTLVPDYHLCVVSETQIVETVPEALVLLQATANLPTTFISGPSATADIEMTRIKGVHGPRTLEVICIGSS